MNEADRLHASRAQLSYLEAALVDVARHVHDATTLEDPYPWFLRETLQSITTVAERAAPIFAPAREHVRSPAGQEGDPAAIGEEVARLTTNLWLIGQEAGYGVIRDAGPHEAIEVLRTVAAIIDRTREARTVQSLSALRVEAAAGAEVARLMKSLDFIAEEIHSVDESTTPARTAEVVASVGAIINQTRAGEKLTPAPERRAAQLGDAQRIGAGPGTPDRWPARAGSDREAQTAARLARTGRLPATLAPRVAPPSVLQSPTARQRASRSEPLER